MPMLCIDCRQWFAANVNRMKAEFFVLCPACVAARKIRGVPTKEAPRG